MYIAIIIACATIKRISIISMMNKLSIRLPIITHIVFKKEVQRFNKLIRCSLLLHLTEKIHELHPIFFIVSEWFPWMQQLQLLSKF